MSKVIKDPADALSVVGVILFKLGLALAFDLGVTWLISTSLSRNALAGYLYTATFYSLLLIPIGVVSRSCYHILNFQERGSSRQPRTKL